jgi:hypothetical protein
MMLASLPELLKPATPGLPRQLVGMVMARRHVCSGADSCDGIFGARNFGSVFLWLLLNMSDAQDSDLLLCMLISNSVRVFFKGSIVSRIVLFKLIRRILLWAVNQTLYHFNNSNFDFLCISIRLFFDSLV